MYSIRTACRWLDTSGNVPCPHTEWVKVFQNPQPPGDRLVLGHRVSGIGPWSYNMIHQQSNILVLKSSKPELYTTNWPKLNLKPGFFARPSGSGSARVRFRPSAGSRHGPVQKTVQKLLGLKNPAWDLNSFFEGGSEDKTMFVLVPLKPHPGRISA